MARQKNALTGYFVAELTEAPGEADYKELAKWISSVTDDTDEGTEEQAWYDGDGTPETDVVSVAEKYTFEGLYDDTDPAMKFIASLKRKTGEGRKIMFKKVESNGETAEGVATVTNIIASGGEAADYATFGCTIGFDKKPEVTPATP